MSQEITARELLRKTISPQTLQTPAAPASLPEPSPEPRMGEINCSEEVAPFEKLIGCHGGAGGPQTSPFILIPQEWEPPKEPIVGSETLNRLLRCWIEGLSNGSSRAVAEEPASPGSDAVTTAATAGDPVSPG